MQASNFSQFMVADTTLEEVRALYGAWVLGQGEFKHKRSSRLRVGVPRKLSLPDLATDADHVRTPQCQIRTRSVSATQWVLQWVHEQPNDSDIRWHNVVRLTHTPAGVQTEHLVGRVFPPARNMRHVAAPPQIVSHLVGQFGNQITPRNLFGGLHEMTEADVADFVRYILLDDARAASLVVVSPTNSGGRPLVDAGRLAGALAGMATVYVLRGPKASWALADALEERGLGTELGCYDGAVRLYRPGLSDGAEPAGHPLLLPWWIRQAGSPVRGLAQCAGRLVDLLTRDVNVPMWLNLVGRHDIEAHQRSANELVRTMLPPPVADDQPGMFNALVERDQQIVALKQEITAYQELLDEAAQDLDEALAREKAAVAQRDDLQEQRDEATHRAKTANDIGSVAAALSAAERLFGEKLVVLPSAHRSASDSPYRKPDRVFSALCVMAMSNGESAYRISEVLTAHHGNGVKWRPKDSPQTLRKFKEDRTFTCSAGTRKLFKSHLTFGGSEDPVKNAQLYYDILPGGRIEVAYVGRHLRTVSHNT